MTDTKPKEPEPREFALFILDRPKTHLELGQGLKELVAAVRDTGKAGTLTLVISVKPFEGDIDTLQVNDDVKLKLPVHDRKPGIFYPDRDGNLTRNDPNAMDFSTLVDVPSHNPATGELKELPNG